MTTSNAAIRTAHALCASEEVRFEALEAYPDEAASLAEAKMKALLRECTAYPAEGSVERLAAANAKYEEGVMTLVRRRR